MYEVLGKVSRDRRPQPDCTGRNPITGSVREVERNDRLDLLHRSGSLTDSVLMPTPTMLSAMSTSAKPQDVLAAAWVAVLGSPASATSDFYALGGDSLTAVRIARIVSDDIPDVPDLDAFVMTEILDQGRYPEIEAALVDYVNDNR